MANRSRAAGVHCVIALSLIAAAQRSPARESSSARRPAWAFFHDGLSSVAISPDGRQVISGGHAPIIRLWNARTREHVRTLDGHEANIRGLAFSPDGKTAMSASYDKTARLWDVATGKEVRRFVGHEAGLEAVSFSRDGSLALTAGQDRNLILWEVESGRALRRFKGHTSWVSSCVFSPDGKKVLSGSGDGTLRLWDAETAAELRVFRGHAADVCDVCYSPDGRLLASASFDGTVKVWNPRTGKEVRTLRAASTAALPGLEQRESPYSLAFLPDGKRLVAAMGDGSLHVWDVATARTDRALFGGSSGVGYVDVSADGRRAVSGSGDTLVVWDLVTWKDVHSRQIGEFKGHTEAVKCVAVSPDGAMVLSGGEDNTVRLWELGTGRETLCLWGHTREVTQVLFRPGGKTAISVSPRGHRPVRVWDLEKGEQRKAASVKFGLGIAAAALSPDGSRAVVAAEEMSFEDDRMAISSVLTVWDVDGDKVAGSFKTDGCGTLAVSPDGRKLAVGGKTTIPMSRAGAGAPCPITIWDLEAGTQAKTLEGHASGVTSLALLGESGRLLSAGADGTIKLWDLRSGKRMRSFLGHSQHATPRCIALSTDGKRAATGSWSGLVSLWDVEAGVEIDWFRAHGEPITCLAFTPDGTRIVSGSMDATLRVWRVTGPARLRARR